MDSLTAVEIDAWLRQGGIVVTASERATRALNSAFHRARQAEGLKAWNAPNIQDWNSFVGSAWAARTLDGRLLLNSTQEQALWAQIAAADESQATLLEGPRYRLAALAMQAHELLCTHAPRYLRPTARSSWQNDADAFSRWLSAFEEVCRSGNLLSPARLPVELLPLLQSPNPSGSELHRPPLLLAGFDRLLPLQRAIFDAWGTWQQAALGEPALEAHFHEAVDDQAELAACAAWAARQLAAHPQARILIVTQSANQRRGQIERALFRHIGSTGFPLFEFSLGVPLSQIALPRAGYLLLRWLSSPLAEHELDWLFSTGYAVAGAEESAALQTCMRSLRRRGLQQPSWTIESFLASFTARPEANPLPGPWVDRITQAQARLSELSRKPQTPLDWAEFIPQLLQSLQFAASQPLSSSGFQALRRWQQTLETAGSLGFDDRRMEWRDFLSVLGRALDETLFAPESRDASIQIAGPAESAGLAADSLWFLDAGEDAWPVAGGTHPLLPPEVQREAAMPHASPQLDWDLALAITKRLLASAREVHFSCARQIEGIESRPSRLVVELVGPPQSLAPAPETENDPPLQTELVEDSSPIPHPPGKVSGGSSVLTSQSQCPFKAFATARLAAQSWESAQAGLTASQRGQLLHAVLHGVWAGPPHGIRSHADLLQLPDRQSFVKAHVDHVFATEVSASLRARLPARYLQLEQQRLTRLVTAWLDYESTRIPFDVLETEAERPITLSGLDFRLRLDRLDRLNDGSVLVVDYKSGNVSPKSWDLPRPDDVQLPLYAGFALDEDQLLGGLTFAKLRPGDLAFTGCIGAPAETLFAGLKNNNTLVKNALTAEQLIEWKDYIEQLSEDFLAGRAEVDPRDAPKTCERCGLQTLCRIQEHQALFEDEGDGEDQEAGDE